MRSLCKCLMMEVQVVIFLLGLLLSANVNVV